MYHNTKYTQKIKPVLVASYDIRPGNGEGLFLFRHLINLSRTYLLRHPLTYSPRPTLFTRENNNLSRNKWGNSAATAYRLI